MPPAVSQRTDSALTTEPVLPRPAIALDSLPKVIEVSIAEQDALLDRARLHIVLARKALGKADTLTAVDECNQAAQRLDRAGYIPGIDDDTAFVELSRSLLMLYQLSAPAIIRSNIEIPPSVLAVIVSPESVVDTVDLSFLNFKEPPPTTVPLPMNEQVEKNIVYFSTKMRNHFAKWIDRSGRYFPMMQPILKEEGIPDELIYLTMIESGVNPLARSWAKCVGLWQFLKSTGEMYGLRGDWFFDDRRNPEKSTRAAARHLRDLYNRFKDWHLALAAYNAGVGRIERAIARSVTKNPSYWDIQELLPTETQNYVPRYIAAAIIALNKESYDFASVESMKPLEYDVVTVNAPYSVEALAECVGLTADEFLEYNPFLLQTVTPPGVKDFEIRIPKGRTQTFASNIVTIKPEKTTTMVAHKVKRGETIYKLAKLYDVPVANIKRANEMSRTRRLVPGEILNIPKLTLLDNTSYTIAVDNIASPSREDDDLDPSRRTGGRERQTVKIERGMTLGGIAARYGVTISDLMIWNTLRSDDVIKTGREIVVWTKPGTAAAPDTMGVELPSATASASVALQHDIPAQRPAAVANASVTKASKAERYRVRHGESLASIADAFNVTIENLKFWNKLTSNSVRSGKVLKIYKPQQSSLSAQKPELPRSVSEGSVKTPGTYTVKGGETLWSIAQATSTSPDDLRRWNNLDDDKIKPGQVLTLSEPLRTARADNRQAPERAQKSADPAASSSSPTQSPESYTVVKGDNLWSISKTAGVSMQDLKSWNDLKDEQVDVGQVLRLRPKDGASTAKVSPKVVRPETRSAPTTHTVRKGDNLFSIAREHNVSVADLRRWNSLAEDRVRIGQEVRITGTGMEESQDEKQDKQPAPRKYVVEDGDTFYGIAKKLGVSVTDLQEWNSRTRILKAGQEISYFPTE